VLCWMPQKARACTPSRGHVRIRRCQTPSRYLPFLFASRPPSGAFGSPAYAWHPSALPQPKGAGSRDGCMKSRRLLNVASHIVSFAQCSAGSVPCSAPPSTKALHDGIPPRPSKGWIGGGRYLRGSHHTHPQSEPTAAWPSHRGGGQPTPLAAVAGCWFSPCFAGRGQPNSFLPRLVANRPLQLAPCCPAPLLP
jgi:hypothetical protein